MYIQSHCVYPLVREKILLEEGIEKTSEYTPQHRVTFHTLLSGRH